MDFIIKSLNLRIKIIYYTKNLFKLVNSIY